jgi:phage shock protein A
MNLGVDNEVDIMSVQSLRVSLVKALTQMDGVRHSLDQLKKDSLTDPQAQERMDRVSEFILQGNFLEKLKEISEKVEDLKELNDSHKKNVSSLMKMSLELGKKYNIELPEDVIKKATNAIELSANVGNVGEYDGKDISVKKMAIKNRKFV